MGPFFVEGSNDQTKQQIYIIYGEFWRMFSEEFVHEVWNHGWRVFVSASSAADTSNEPNLEVLPAGCFSPPRVVEGFISNLWKAWCHLARNVRKVFEQTRLNWMDRGYRPFQCTFWKYQGFIKVLSDLECMKSHKFYSYFSKKMSKPLPWSWMYLVFSFIGLVFSFLGVAL